MILSFLLVIFALTFLRALTDAATGYEEKGSRAAKILHSILLQMSGIFAYILLLEVLK